MRSLISAILLMLGASANAQITTINENLWTTNNSQYFDNTSSYTVLSGSASVVGNSFSVGGSALVVSNGNVGIGTASPGTKLTVAGTIFSNSASNTGTVSYSLNSAGANNGTISNQGTGIWGLGYSPSLTSTGTNVLSWNSSGNVGIGTLSPNATLAVSGTIFSNASNASKNVSYSLNSAGANNGTISNNGTGSWSLGYSPSTLSTGTDVLTWNASGNVGIGTTSPTTALSVYGIITSSTPIPSVSCTAGSPTIGANSGNNSGTFTAGALATACTVTFANAFPKAPVCVCNASTPLALSATTATNSVTCTAATALTGDTLNYFCWGVP